MHTATERLEFAPPATPGLLRALLLAMLAHGLLVAVLTWGVQWKHEAQTSSFEAELWATVPQEAAPKLQTPPPEPTAVEVPKLPKKSVPEPPPVMEPAKVDITLEQENRRIQKQKQFEIDKLRQEKIKAEKRKQELADKAQKAQDKKQAEAQAKQLETQRQKNLQRITGLAGASGSSTSTGNATQSAGPSASYAGRIRARIKPNIVFTEDMAGNPSAEVEVRAAPDGTIVSRMLNKSSGSKAWDEAVLKAIDKTDTLPRDIDGRVPSSLVISFRPKD